MPMLFDIEAANDKREKEGKARSKIYIDIAGINGDDTPTHFIDCITTLTKDEKETIWFGEHDDPSKPEGHWCPPYGSYFFFDECHKLEWVKDGHGSISKNPTTISLNEHGHAGHTIKLITQFPQYIHTHIRGLIAEHWHVKRKMGTRWARVYKFDEFKLSPRSDSSMKDAHEVENFFFKKKWQDAYKSASAHEPQKIKVPMILALPVIAIFVIIGLVWFFGKDSFIFKDKQTAEQVEQLEKQATDAASQNQQQLEEINGIRLELEELKQKYLPKHIALLAEHEDVRPAMIIASSTSCVAYNTYGEPLLISDSLCYQMNESPSLIPRSRQARQEATTVDDTKSESNIDNPFQASSPQPPIAPFESPKPYT